MKKSTYFWIGSIVGMIQYILFTRFGDFPSPSWFGGFFIGLIIYIFVLIVTEALDNLTDRDD